ncbi:MAG: InlB B-repeat-containing protein [Clostridia bacterium]|nr:InlB B-repeat-containing protein [Clostridia bacterium]MBR2447056.1 InlB B-repeat-containing protein [Clostridia bacterium]
MNKEKRRISLPWWLPYSIPVVLFAVIMIFIFTDTPEYTVKFPPGYDGGRDRTETVERKDTVPVPDDIYRPGYTFAGWWFKDEKGWRLWDFENDKVYEDITLTARWEHVTYTMTLDANGGECDITEYTVQSGVPYEMPAPTREGYTFAGWYCGGQNMTKGIYPYIDDVPVKARWVTYPLGMTVKIGRFEQDGDLDNGPEEIEWYVVDYKDGKYYLISKYLLLQMPYSEEYRDPVWETSLMRAYLNGEFFDTTFTEQERQYIVPTSLPEGVTDRVFLLNEQDIKETVVDVLLRMGIPSDYLLKQGVVLSNGCCDLMHQEKVYRTTWYCLRGNTEVDGWAYSLGDVQSPVRPAMWIDESYVNGTSPEIGEEP